MLQKQVTHLELLRTPPLLTTLSQHAPARVDNAPPTNPNISKQINFIAEVILYLILSSQRILHV